MSAFIETLGGFVAVAEVRSLSRGRDGNAVLELTDGTSRNSPHKYDDVVVSMGPVVPNTTGAVGIRISVDDDSEPLADGMYPVFTWREPIVAWRITPKGAIAILADDTEITHILSPDGTLISMFGSYFECIEDAIADERRTAKPRSK